MSLNSFKNLVECQSLDLKIEKHLSNIAEQKGRITHLEGLRGKRDNQKNENLDSLTQGQKLISQKETELYDIERKLNKAKENLNLAVNEQQSNALEKEINTLAPKVESLENEILERIELNEQLEVEINEASEFLAGSSETLQDIQIEVEQNSLTENQEIQKYQERIDLLLEACELNFREAFLNANTRFRFKKPISFITGNKCSECKFQLSAVLIPQVEQGQSLEFCTGCNRLLAPTS